MYTILDLHHDVFQGITLKSFLKAIIFLFTYHTYDRTQQTVTVLTLSFVLSKRGRKN